MLPSTAALVLLLAALCLVDAESLEGAQAVQLEHATRQVERLGADQERSTKRLENAKAALARIKIRKALSEKTTDVGESAMAMTRRRRRRSGRGSRKAPGWFMPAFMMQHAGLISSMLTAMEMMNYGARNAGKAVCLPDDERMFMDHCMKASPMLTSLTS